MQGQVLNMTAASTWKIRTRCGEARADATKDTEEWPVIREMLTRVLARFPEARAAVLEGMQEMRVTANTRVILVDETRWRKDSS